MTQSQRSCNVELLGAYIRLRGYRNNADLARGMGVSRSLLCKLFRPDHPFKNADRINEISSLLGAPAEILFPWVQDRKPNNQHQAINIEGCDGFNSRNISCGDQEGR